MPLHATPAPTSPHSCARPTRGFTLVELMIVIAIIAVITAIAVPNLVRSREAATEAGAIQTLRAIAAAQELYLASYGRYGSLWASTASVADAGGAAPTIEQILDLVSEVAHAQSTGGGEVNPDGTVNEGGHSTGEGEVAGEKTVEQPRSILDFLTDAPPAGFGSHELVLADLIELRASEVTAPNGATVSIYKANGDYGVWVLPHDLLARVAPNDSTAKQAWFAMALRINPSGQGGGRSFYLDQRGHIRWAPDTAGPLSPILGN